MCDKELLIGYLYGELASGDRESFDRHLASCADCRAEVAGLRGTRTHLTSWAPPEPDLGFEIVRTARPAAPARWWRPSPAWGLAAAAVLVMGVAAAIANLHVRVGADGLVVSTGWSRSTPQAAVPPDALSAAVNLQRLEARVKELESQTQTLRPTLATPASTRTDVPRLTDAELMRAVRQIVAEAEQRQEGVLARQILQVNRDVQTARQADYDRLLYVIQKLQGTSAETSFRQKAIEDHLLRVAMPR